MRHRGGRFIGAGAAAALALAVGAAGAEAQEIPGRYIVVLKAGASPAAVAARHGLAPEHTFGAALNGFAGPIPPAALVRIAADADTESIEPDRVVTAFAQETPTGVRRIGAPLNGTADIDGMDGAPDVDIAIIDTGIDLDHPDLRVSGGVSFAKGNTTGDDGNGHGSHCAGIAAARDNGIGVVGVCPGARLWAVRVLDNRGSGSISNVIKGIDWVTARASNPATRIEVANMSLGATGYSAAFHTAVRSCVGAGVVVCVAAGNEERDVFGADGIFGTGDDVVPACFPEAAAISALCDTDGIAGGAGPASASGYGPDDTLASFSNYARSEAPGNPVFSSGGAIDFAAPGVEIFSTVKDGGYDTYSGTSMASPHGAGAAALLIVRHGLAPSTAADVYAIRQALIDAAEAQSAWGPADARDPDAKKEGALSVRPEDPPVVTILSPADGAAFASGIGISFSGDAFEAGDESVGADALVWTSSKDGIIGFGGAFAADLSNGRHVIQAAARDGAGDTGSASISISVGPTISLAISTDKSVYLDGETVVITCRVTDGAGTAVEGASVHLHTEYPPFKKGAVTIYKYSDRYGTTGADGIATLTHAANGSQDGYGVYKYDGTATFAGAPDATTTGSFEVRKP
jgi:subtilisin family serine protease